MSGKPDDGGTVFSRQYDDVRHDGMMLWDWYAGESLRGAVANQLSNPRLAAKIAADMADAMLDERRNRGIGTT